VFVVSRFAGSECTLVAVLSVGKTGRQRTGGKSSPIPTLYDAIEITFYLSRSETDELWKQFTQCKLHVYLSV
jgi:hypothetical protein